MKELVESLEIKRVIAEVDNLRNGNDTFYLWSNQIGVEGAKAIAESIKVNKTITYLNLHLEDKITKEIQEYIQRNVNISKGYNPQAEELKIQGNILSNKGEHGKAIEKYNEAITNY
ncbi:hypothetical protein A1I_04185 [Rickettsia bellii OSU 85-389]|uniref:hypothetical protein n=1 Tax=Rickettsia bellii TaxID=33990 RepID=UPI0000DB0F28|nr:hypothetical protein [Rickettsia bellii]ABV79187.1 hypothetical protein A1I_04185 [Rickettsia bellii OSU 85-389]